MKLITNTDWKGLYELLNDLIRTEDTETLLSEFKSNFINVMPADRGVPMFEIDKGLPICTQWPEYSSKLIPLFNNKFNSICPVKYSSYLDGLKPVSWKRFKDSEYDTDFNVPLDIGSSMGQGFFDPYDSKFKVIVLNRGRRSRTFTPDDLSTFKSIINSFSVLYIQREQKNNKFNKLIYSLQQNRGCTLLSNRETQVCRMMYEGMTAIRIAEVLGISRRTVERHSLHIYEKLNVNNKKELIRMIKT